MSLEQNVMLASHLQLNAYNYIIYIKYNVGCGCILMFGTM